MEINSTDFIASFPKESLCPKDSRAEFAFIGRSNVGKSSLINMLTGKKGLAKVSGTPGKTQLLNFFLINKSWYLVDLPGYGYAKVSKEKQRTLSKIIGDYLLNRESLLLAFVLIDANISPPSEVDLDFINHLGEHSVPFSIVFTKADRLKPGALERNVELFKEKLLETWETLPSIFISSSERRTGREEILGYIASLSKDVARSATREPVRETPITRKTKKVKKARTEGKAQSQGVVEKSGVTKGKQAQSREFSGNKKDNTTRETKVLRGAKEDRETGVSRNGTRETGVSRNKSRNGRETRAGRGGRPMRETELAGKSKNDSSKPKEKNTRETKVLRSAKEDRETGVSRNATRETGVSRNVSRNGTRNRNKPKIS